MKRGKSVNLMYWENARKMKKHSCETYNLIEKKIKRWCSILKQTFFNAENCDNNSFISSEILSVSLSAELIYAFITLNV